MKVVKRFTKLGSAPTRRPKIRKVARLFCLKLYSVSVDYVILKSEGASQLGLAKGGGRKLAQIYQVKSKQPLLCAKNLGRIHHSNVVQIYGAYFFRGTLSIATENLQITLDQFTLDSHPLAESEVATILREVILGASYLFKAGFSCEHLGLGDIGFTLRGDVKLKINHLVQAVSAELPHSLELLVLTEIMEQILEASSMSTIAKSFFDSSIGRSILNLRNHRFLQAAASSEVLVSVVNVQCQLHLEKVSS